MPGQTGAELLQFSWLSFAAFLPHGFYASIFGIPSHHSPVNTLFCVRDRRVGGKRQWTNRALFHGI